MALHEAKSDRKVEPRDDGRVLRGAAISALWRGTLGGIAMTTFDDIREICLALPGSVEGEGRFGFSVVVKGKHKGYCWTWMERVQPKKPKVENERVLAVLVPGLAAKEVLLDSDPRCLFTEPHYNGFPAVLVRLDEIAPAELEPLLEDAWRSLTGSAR